MELESLLDEQRKTAKQLVVENEQTIVDYHYRGVSLRKIYSCIAKLEGDDIPTYKSFVGAYRQREVAGDLPHPKLKPHEKSKQSGRAKPPQRTPFKGNSDRRHSSSKEEYPAREDHQGDPADRFRTPELMEDRMQPIPRRKKPESPQPEVEENLPADAGIDTEDEGSGDAASSVKKDDKLAFIGDIM